MAKTQVAQEPAEVPEPQTLTWADRCDRCGAAAMQRFILPSGQDLLLCGHHTRAHEAVLTEKFGAVTSV